MATNLAQSTRYHARGKFTERTGWIVAITRQPSSPFHARYATFRRGEKNGEEEALGVITWNERGVFFCHFHRFLLVHHVNQSLPKANRFWQWIEYGAVHAIQYDDMGLWGQCLIGVVPTVSTVITVLKMNVRSLDSPCWKPCHWRNGVFGSFPTGPSTSRVPRVSRRPYERKFHLNEDSTIEQDEVILENAYNKISLDDSQGIFFDFV